MSQRNKKNQDLKFLKTYYRRKELPSPLSSPSLNTSSNGRLQINHQETFYVITIFRARLFSSIETSKVPIKPPNFCVINGNN